MSSPKPQVKNDRVKILFSCWTRKGGFYFGKNFEKEKLGVCCISESAPSDWIEQLQLSGAQFAISPLHDKDLNATGEPKKAHCTLLWFMVLPQRRAT